MKQSGGDLPSGVQGLLPPVSSRTVSRGKKSRVGGIHWEKRGGGGDILPKGKWGTLGEPSGGRKWGGRRVTGK